MSEKDENIVNEGINEAAEAEVPSQEEKKSSEKNKR